MAFFIFYSFLNNLFSNYYLLFLKIYNSFADFFDYNYNVFMFLFKEVIC
jgi:hypothetical protein